MKKFHTIPAVLLLCMLTAAPCGAGQFAEGRNYDVSAVGKDQPTAEKNARVAALRAALQALDQQDFVKANAKAVRRNIILKYSELTGDLAVTGTTPNQSGIKVGASVEVDMAKLVSLLNDMGAKASMPAEQASTQPAAETTAPATDSAGTPAPAVADTANQVQPSVGAPSAAQPQTPEDFAKQILTTLQVSADRIAYDDGAKTLTLSALSGKHETADAQTTFKADDAVLTNYRLETLEGAAQPSPAFDTMELHNLRFNTVSAKEDITLTAESLNLDGRFFLPASSPRNVPPTGSASPDAQAGATPAPTSADTATMPAMGWFSPELLKEFKTLAVKDVKLNWLEKKKQVCDGGFSTLAITCPDGKSSKIALNGLFMNIDDGVKANATTAQIECSYDAPWYRIAEQFLATLTGSGVPDADMVASKFILADTVVRVTVDPSTPEMQFRLKELSSSQNALDTPASPLAFTMSLQDLEIPSALLDLPLGLLEEPQVKALKAFLPDGARLSFSLSANVPPQKQPGTFSMALGCRELFDLNADLDVQMDSESMPTKAMALLAQLGEKGTATKLTVKLADRGLLGLATVLGAQSMQADVATAAQMAGSAVPGLLPPAIAPAVTQMLEKPGRMTLSCTSATPISIAKITDIASTEGLTFEGKTEQGPKTLFETIPEAAAATAVAAPSAEQAPSATHEAPAAAAKE